MDTWVALPRNRRPRDENGKSLWDHIDTPCVPLIRNLYGHKLAGLLWQKYSELKIMKMGFGKVVDWECLYFHRIWKVFLSVYVDDLKAAGPATSLKLMWTELKKHLDIDPPKKMIDNQYLGCSQRDIFPEEVDMERMSPASANFSVNRGDAAARVAHPELRKD